MSLRYVILGMLLITVGTSAQVQFGTPQRSLIGEELFPIATIDTLPIRTLSALGKIELTNVLDSQMASDYNWTRSIRNRESLKRAASGFRQNDSNGREIIPEMTTQLTHQILFKELPQQ